MTSPESSNPNSSVVHQFIVSDSMTNQCNLDEQDYPSFQSSGRNRTLLPQSLGVLPSIQSLGQRFSTSVELFQDPSLPEDSETCSRRHLMNLLETTNERDYQGQRLSLTLGSHLPSHILVPPHVNPLEHIRDEDSFANTSTSYEPESFATVIGNSRYLRPAQSLLEEVVSVGGNAIDLTSDESITPVTRKNLAELYSDRSSSTGEHESQTTVNKLGALLEEVESRYQRYCGQMEEVISTFEMIGGRGAAKSYTSQALQAMSRHFCSLRDAIITQIQISKQQTSQDLPRARTGVSQLTLFDQVTRHKGVPLQQLGMIQTRQVWRPARGLPENSVGILRAWLFEHFLHPYPNDSEKLMLASQTGLTKNQVSNWFINARVRLWKPMIEEMYKEEFAESSMDSTQQENSSRIGESLSKQAGK